MCKFGQLKCKFYEKFFLHRHCGAISRKNLPQGLVFMKIFFISYNLMRVPHENYTLLREAAKKALFLVDRLLRELGAKRVCH